MDLRPAAVLEADDARMEELRRRRDPMAVTTRIRMVDQPPEGLLPLSLFDRTLLPDRTALHPRSMETVSPDIAGLYVDYVTRIAMGVPKRVAFRIPLLGARLVGQGEYAESGPAARPSVMVIAWHAVQAMPAVSSNPTDSSRKHSKATCPTVSNRVTLMPARASRAMGTTRPMHTPIQRCFFSAMIISFVFRTCRAMP